MRILRAVWNYLGESQPVFFRVLHLVIIGLIASQFITSDFVEIGPGHRTGGILGFDAGTLAHILPGMAVAVLLLVFTVGLLLRHGVRHFFPYLWGDLRQIREDIAALRQRRLPDASPGGLATTVQGLGLGAVGLTVASALTWLLLPAGSAVGHTAIELHEAATNLVIAYLIGHGGMGLLHFLLWLRAAPAAGPRRNGAGSA